MHARTHACNNMSVFCHSYISWDDSDAVRLPRVYPHQVNVQVCTHTCTRAMQEKRLLLGWLIHCPAAFRPRWPRTCPCRAGLDRPGQTQPSREKLNCQRDAQTTLLFLSTTTTQRICSPEAPTPHLLFPPPSQEPEPGPSTRKGKQKRGEEEAGGRGRGGQSPPQTHDAPQNNPTVHQINQNALAGTPI